MEHLPKGIPMTYLITGATSGLGLQVALRLARKGGHQLILPVRNIARGVALRQLVHPLRPITHGCLAALG